MGEDIAVWLGKLFYEGEEGIEYDVGGRGANLDQGIARSENELVLVQVLRLGSGSVRQL